jgi:hypothetical protein
MTSTHNVLSFPATPADALHMLLCTLPTHALVTKSLKKSCRYAGRAVNRCERFVFRPDSILREEEALGAICKFMGGLSAKLIIII